MSLTESQRLAVTCGGRNLQLIACAGSGKTEVLAHRVVHLLTPGHPLTLTPQNIAAFTFTEKAAAELRHRIFTRTEQALGPVENLSDLFVGTIHGFCFSILRSEVPSFFGHGVLNEVQQGLFINRFSKQSGLTNSTDLRDRPLSRFRDTARYAQAMSLLREMDCEESAMKGVSVRKGLAAYMSLLNQHRYFDFSAVLEEAVEVLSQNEEVRERLRSRLKCVIVDEYQDVNPIQEKLIELLHGIGAAVCVVGDDDQTIYQWRGSDVSNILSFASKYPGVEKIALEENFRSSKGVGATARAFIEQNATRLEKSMKPAGAQSYEEGDIVASKFDDPTEEAEYLAQTAKHLLGVAFREQDTERGLSWSDMAILLRSVKANAQPIIGALEKAGIPYVVVGMADLFTATEAEAARQLFYFLAKYAPPDEEPKTRPQIEAIWIASRLGITRESLARALDEVIASRRAIFGDSGASAGWSEYSLQRLFFRFLETAEVREERVPDGRGEVCFYNLGKFSQVISDFETINFKTSPRDKLQAFAEFLHYQASQAYPEGWQDNRYANPDAIRIMTVHQAKGMQWPVVFLPALTRNRFPAARKGGASVWDLIPREAVIGHQRLLGTEEDERRLFYVAMTRSQKFLHMTWAPVPGKSRYSKPSRFWQSVCSMQYVSKQRPDYSVRSRLPPTARPSTTHVEVSITNLKYFFECPYQFKMRALYGFNPPLHEALGYGRSIRDALADAHSRLSSQETLRADAASDLLDKHLHLPYAYPALETRLRDAATRNLRNYLEGACGELSHISYEERPVSLRLGDSVMASGSVDILRYSKTGETSVVDFKTTSRHGSEEVTEDQLRAGVAGYVHSTGQRPDYIEVRDVEAGTQRKQPVDSDLIADVTRRSSEAADALKTGVFEPNPGHEKCERCDFLGLCSAATVKVAQPLSIEKPPSVPPQTPKPNEQARPRSWFRKLFG